MSQPILLLFGLMAPLDAPASAQPALARLEQDVVRTLALQGFEVRPPPLGVLRPAISDARNGQTDVAARLEVPRVLVLDVTPELDGVWVTHYLRGVSGAWDLRKVACRARLEFECPGLVNGVLGGLRPRTHLDIDLGSQLRSRARDVSRCVRAEDQRPPAERIYGRIDVVLEMLPSGGVEVRSLAPSRVARATLGACLRNVFEGIDVGRYEGPPVSLRLPIDL